MKFGKFLNPTPLYNKYIILSMIAHNPHVTQRAIASEINMSVSTVNICLEEYEKEGLLTREYVNTKVVAYNITNKGEEERKYLNIEYLKSSLLVVNDANSGCATFFVRILNKGFKNVLFYGAGELAEILLSVYDRGNYDFDILGIIDDDYNKIGKFLKNRSIISIDDINRYKYDGIFISTYSNVKDIYDKLIEKGIDKELIVTFFDVK